MRSDKAWIRHSGEDWVSCPGKLKKKIEEAGLNLSGVRVQRGVKTLRLSKAESSQSKLSPRKERSKDEEFGSIENQVGEEIKLS
jgi:hypothetical protein